MNEVKAFIEDLNNAYEMYVEIYYEQNPEAKLHAETLKANVEQATKLLLLLGNELEDFWPSEENLEDK